MARYHILCLVGAYYALATLAMARSLPRVPAAMTGPIALGVADPPSSSALKGTGSATGVAGGPEEQQAGDSPTADDKSIAGAEVILGGLATAVLAIIYCYIRVTRRPNAEGKA